MKKTIKTAILICVFLLICALSFSACNGEETPQEPLDSNGTDETEESTESNTSEDNIQFLEVSSTDRLFADMTENNYYEVTDFSIGSTNTDLSEITPIVSFSYVPLESRPWSTSDSFRHDMARFQDLSIDSNHAFKILEGIMHIRSNRTLKPNSDRSDTVLAEFCKQFGVSYTFSFTHEGKRDTEALSTFQHKTDYDFLVSSLTSSNTYYLFDKNALTLSEVDAESLSFLKESPEDWYDRYIYAYHIGLVNKIEVDIKDGTDVGVRGVTRVTLEHRSTDQNGMPLHPLDIISAGPNAILHVTANYNGESKEITDTSKYRDFYAGILWSAVGEWDFSETVQEQLKKTASDMTIKIYLSCDDWNKTLEYRLFADNSVLINGVYVGKLVDGQLSALIDAVGLMLSPNPSDVIDFW